jgi:hypothetical protein
MSMRAVWSFWSKPFAARGGRVWREPKHHLLAWGLSFRLAREHYPETVLVADTAGKALLVDKLGLEFAEVSTELDRLRDADLGWWSLGKLIAYNLQDRPFVHLDNDVFLWRALPSALTSAPVFAQCPECHSLQHAWCRPGEVVSLFERHGCTLPAEWEWAASCIDTWFRQENCGILGGQRIDFLRYYSGLGIRLVTDPAHVALWAELPEKSVFTILIEQFLLAACLDYHRFAPGSVFRGIAVRHLFPSWEAACNPQSAARAGYTHLMGDIKSHPAVATRLERRMATLDPAFHRHCQRVSETAM